MIIFIMKNAVKHFKKLKLMAEILDIYGLFCFEVANFCKYFGQFLIFISGNPA